MTFDHQEVADLLGRLSEAKSPSGFEEETIAVVRVASRHACCTVRR